MDIVALRLARSSIHAAVAALVILCLAIPTPAVAQVVRGRVVDAESGAAVALALARVAVTGSGQRALRTTTAKLGRLMVRLRRGGPFRVQVARAGYAARLSGADVLVRQSRASSMAPSSYGTVCANATWFVDRFFFPHAQAQVQMSELRRADSRHGTSRSRRSPAVHARGNA
jgi:hypothetical protein